MAEVVAERRSGLHAGRTATIALAPARALALPAGLSVDRAWGGRFQGEASALSALCRRLFGSFGPWIPHPEPVVFVAWGRLTGAASEAPLSFLSVSMLVVPRVASASATVRSAVTHLFLDHAWAMSLARELVGFPAYLAEFESVNDAEFAVNLVSDRGSSSPVLRLNVSEGQPVAGWEEPWLRAGRQQMHPLEAPIDFVQLKQFRDGMQPGVSCYQELVEGSLHLRAEGQAQPVRLSIDLAPDAFLTKADLGLAVLETELGYHFNKVTLGMQLTSPTDETTILTGRDGPPLRERRGDQQAAPEYNFAGVDIVGFRVPIAPEHLQRICDERLNAPFPHRSYKYVPIGVDLVIECLDYPSMTSENPPFGVPKTTSVSQRELILRMLVGRVDEGGRRTRAPAVFCPFVFVDSPLSLVSGREVIGYPKVLARFDTLGQSGQFEVCRVVAAPPSVMPAPHVPLITFDCRFERDPVQVAELFDGARGVVPSGRVPRGAESVNFSWWNLDDLQSAEAGESVIDTWLEGQAYGYAGVQLKRFPQARNPLKDCYLELVEAQYTLVRAEVTLPPYKASLHFADPAQDPYGLVEAFGFSRIVPVPPGAWYRTTADVRFRVIDPLE